jgi:hypothetical protein
MTGNAIAQARAGTAVLDEAAIAELRAFNAGFEQWLAVTPPVESVLVSESRTAAREGSGTIPPPSSCPSHASCSSPAGPARSGCACSHRSRR